MKIYHSLNNSENLENSFLKRKEKKKTYCKPVANKKKALFQAHLSLFINMRIQKKYF